ncbi:MAG: phosphoribosylaminoimidazolesuccinocarboxamide synthase [Actinobacteria bacterium]|nr:phosphoribosylaminoimidazolesuccinocarboxamide synthase [Actinomycetota bacterium]
MTNAPTAPDYGLGAEYEHIYSGKVRDLYRTPDDRLLFVASDRISAYDWVLPTTIPDKGRILTALSKWWFKRLEGVVPNHVASGRIPKAVAGRAMVCERLDMLPVECVVRGYLAGSGYTDYLAQGSICGNGLPPGLKDGASPPKHLFTPATKAALGEHDENVTFDEVIVEIGQEEAQEIKRMSMAVYELALETARERGLILADTKFEFGFARSGKYVGRIVLADEVLTPDSSRYWSAATWAPGGPQPSFDKQYVRDWLTSPESGWDKSSDTPPPPLPDYVVEQTRAKYVEVYEILTGETFV